MFDYRERKYVNRNRPKAKHNGMMFVAIAGALVTVFGLGFASGWFAGKTSRQKSPEPPMAGATASTSAAKTAAPPTTGTPGGVDTPLTFYQTLPKGGKAVIGTGLNPATPPPATPTSTPAATPTDQKAPAVKKEVEKPENKAPAPSAPRAQPAPPSPVTAQASPSTGGGKFTVQVASYQNRQEAESVRDSLVSKGFPAYVKESHNKDKGTWYRIRIGRSLEHKEAASLAEKVGNGAFAVPE